LGHLTVIGDSIGYEVGRHLGGRLQREVGREHHRRPAGTTRRHRREAAGSDTRA
jgi:hypothetical protein